MIAGSRLKETIIEERNEFDNVIIIHGKKDNFMKWVEVEKMYAELLKKKGVKLRLIDGLEHTIYAPSIRKAVFEFLRERT